MKNIFSNMLYWPLFLSLFLVLWTLSVYRFSKYGDLWALLPAGLVWPTVVVLHVVLVIKVTGKCNLIVYGVVHSAMLFAVWIGCLMLISKDSI
jgi:hypothetical protein